MLIEISNQVDGDNSQVAPSQFLSTASAAKILGLSTTLVQTLLDQGDLKGWKTRGGHRRISADSIRQYQAHAHSSMKPKAKKTSKHQISVVVDHAKWVETFKADLVKWELPIDVYFFDSVTEAILDLTTHRPDVVVMELSMPLAQQEKTLLALQNFNKRGKSPLTMVLVTQEKKLALSLPSDSDTCIQLVPGPISSVWLHAYLIGILASRKI